MVLVKGTEWSCGTEKKVRGITHKKLSIPHLQRGQNLKYKEKRQNGISEYISIVLRI